MPLFLDKANYWIELCVKTAIKLHREISADMNASTFSLFLDLTVCNFRYGIRPADYEAHQLYLVNRRLWQNTITLRNGRRIRDAYNNQEICHILKDKHSFNEHYAKYIGREWLYAPDHTPEEISAFVSRLTRVIVKPYNKLHGEGIFITSAEDIDDMPAFAAGAIENEYMLEQVIVQHPDLCKINPHSVNSIRIITMLDKEKHLRIMNAVLRCASDESVIDNYTAGGIVTGIDAKTGVLLANSKSKTSDLLIRHPLTNTIIPGIQIPFWDEVLDTVTQAAMVLPEIRMIGWDVAVTPTGPVIIEANHMPGFSTMQWGTNGLMHMLKDNL